MTTIAVVDYGMGNLRSVAKALEHVAPLAGVAVTGDPDVVARADRVVFPGVGAMPDCLRELAARGLRDALLEAARSKPFLGICLGMQALFSHSEEGGVDGLNLLPGTVRRFPPEAMQDEAGARLKVPHIGWNRVFQAAPHPLWRGIEDGARFYFVHSYYVEPARPGLVAGFTHYPFAFASAVAENNLFAVQFHPEKSQAAGLSLLANFVSWDGAG
jgi:glutamine amidotransferase